MMARTAVCLPLAACLFLANAVLSEAQKGSQSEQSREVVVRVAAGAPLAVECRLRPEQRAEWRRDGGALPAGLRPEPEAAAGDGRLTARLHAAAARPQHAGLYTCTPGREQRVRVLVQRPAAEAVAAGGDAAPGAALDAAPGAAEGGARELLYDVRSNITLRCELANDGGLAYVWRKNGTALEEVWEMKDRYALEHGGAEFRVARALEDDFGNYSCALAGQAPAQLWAVRGRPHLKLPANSNVVEGQKLKLTCKVLGKPYPRVQWSYSNASAEDDAEGANFTALGEGGAAGADGARVTLSASEQGVPDGTLVLEEARREDAGRYRCAAAAAPAPAETLLRVKDKYAALWPFLGICAEVFVLCAIILVYEKRRTKPDLDDSDTDNHDQKKS